MASYYGNGGGFRRRRREEEDVDPLSTVANISDAMLVFACGLMIALIVAWNVNITPTAQIEVDESQSIEQNELLEEQLNGQGNEYVERGTVYEDPATGKLYLVEPGDQAGETGQPDSATGGQTSGE